MASDNYRFRVGDLDCLAVNDGTYSLSADQLFTNAPQKELQEALRRHGLAAEEVAVDAICLLVRSGDETILVDTGMGPDVESTTGKLIRNLQAEGVNPGDVTTVILTHSDGDHIGGLTDSDGELAFPRARFVISKEEWDFCLSDETRAEVEPERRQFLEAKLGPIRSRAEQITADQDIATGVRAVAAAGHTPGHLMVEVFSGRSRLLYISDTLLHPLHLEHPEWYAVFDRDPKMAVQVRRTFLRKAQVENLFLLAFHFPFPGLGYVRSEGDAWRWEPVGP